MPAKSRRRWFSPIRLLIATLALQVICLVLWSITWPSAQEQVELAFVAPQEEVSAWQTVIADFEASHPKIRITLVTDPATTYTTDQRKAIYSADFQAEVAQYDLVYMDIVWTPQFADQLVDLATLAAQDRVDLEGFLASELAAGEYNGGLYRLPMRADVGVLYTRQDVLNQAGVLMPTTLAQLAEGVTTVKQSSQANLGYLWQGRSYEGLIANFMEVMASFGATWIDPDSQRVGLTDPATLQAAQLLRDLISQGISPPIVTDYTEQASLDTFQQGQAPFLRGWPYFWSTLKQQDWGDQVAIAPPFSFTDNPSRGCRGGWGFGIPKNATHPEEAWEAIQYFTSEAAQEKFVLASGFLPSQRSLFQAPNIVEQYPLMPQLLDYLENRSVFRPAIRQYDAASAILQTALGKILRGQQSVEAAMAEAQVATEDLFQPQQG